MNFRRGVDASCFVPDFDGAFLSNDSKDAKARGDALTTVTNGAYRWLMDILARRGVAFKVLRDALSPLWATRRANAAGVRGPGWRRGAGGRGPTPTRLPLIWLSEKTWLYMECDPADGTLTNEVLGIAVVNSSLRLEALTMVRWMPAQLTAWRILAIQDAGNSA
jgi:hypothetical protein